MAVKRVKLVRNNLLPHMSEFTMDAYPGVTFIAVHAKREGVRSMGAKKGKGKTGKGRGC